MMTLQQYAQKWNRPEEMNLAIACYRGNSIAELEEPVDPITPQDLRDLRDWDITDPQELRDAIRAALETKCAEHRTTP